MSYEDLSGGISEHEAGEEFMEREDERRRDEREAEAEKILRRVLNRRGPLFVCQVVSDWYRDDYQVNVNMTVANERLDRLWVFSALSTTDDLFVYDVIGAWCREQRQQAKRSA